jgi:hypothetical protein
MECARYNLHGVRMCAICADICEVATPVHEHPMPDEKQFVRQRLRITSIEISHELGGPRFRRI